MIKKSGTLTVEHSFGDEMADQKKLWEGLKKMPGGDRSPFDIPMGPTKRCLSVRELVSFIEDGEKTEGFQNMFIHNHLAECRECLDWLSRFKAAR